MTPHEWHGGNPVWHAGEDITITTLPHGGIEIVQHGADDGPDMITTTQPAHLAGLIIAATQHQGAQHG